MKNLKLIAILLPTEDASKLCITENKELGFTEKFIGNSGIGYTPHYIYICSARDLKKGDWGIVESNNNLYKVRSISGDKNPEWHKIEFTNDPALIKEGVPALPEKCFIKKDLLGAWHDKEINFLEEFVSRYNNRNVKTVDVDELAFKECGNDTHGKEKYKKGYNQAMKSNAGGFVFPSDEDINDELRKHSPQVVIKWIKHLYEKSNAGGFSLDDMRKCFEKGFSYENFGVPDNREYYFNEFIQSLTPKLQGEVEMYCEMWNTGGTNEFWEIKLINKQPVIHFGKP